MRDSILKVLCKRRDNIWLVLCELYPRLVRYNPPDIKLSARLYRTAGYNHQDENQVILGYKFILYSEQYRDNMINIILPHEIIHQADYNLYGLSEKRCGHGKNWVSMMQAYGLPPDKFHSMDIPR